MSITRRKFVCAGLGAVAAATLPGRVQAAESRPFKAIFINPGRSDEAFWVTVTNFMTAAAKELGIELDVAYGERDRFKTVEIAEARIKAAAPGDYILINNEQRTGGPIYEAAKAKKLKIFVAFSGFTDDETKDIGAPRSTYPNYLGALLPDNVAAGRAMAQGLIAAANKPVTMGAINGLTATPAAADREAGLQQALAEAKDVTFTQIVAADWTRESGQQRMAGFLQRYPHITAMWVANDPMALGAISALEAAGRHPGHDVVVCGLNWDAPAIKEIIDGRLALSAGGHFMAGGWALVMLRDYHDGIDFASSGGLIQSLPFGVIDRTTAEPWQKRFGGGDWSQIGFKRFSRSLNPGLKAYDFSPKTILG